MIIPCIDVMGGKVVQLVQGERKALELNDPDEALAMCDGFPLAHVIDLDAAKGTGDNEELVRYLLQNVRARVGGGVRTAERAKALLDLGAAQVIVGSAAFAKAGPDLGFLKALAGIKDQVIVAIDVKHGQIAVRGWAETIDLTAEAAMEQMEDHCAGFLCTNVDREGLMRGTDLGLFHRLRAKTERTLIAAGGITSIEEVRDLVAAGIQVALGMAIYTGKLDLGQLRLLQSGT